ncbi:MAG: hypothetical protein IM591_13960 [Chitinophagaceae bacterium]|jgi:hypothetical protein|uniref:hypothetical protein n=1 Tax=Microcystis sp. M061S2 TaxID=2771171 RepID=UPI002586E60F|nr:hypothetical protein [Microcystis sp. M061S2]MCA2656611.1 hypothetical protein [Microcystis sp. M061S2]MCA6471482.1 hypothetical protein [Chitinophagaceae bacterium]
MAQQTALEQLIEWIDSDCTPMDCVMKAKELLKVEKQQNRLFWVHGNSTQDCKTTEEINECFELDYNLIYGNNTKKD